MTEKVSTPAKKGDPKEQIVRRPAPQDPAPTSDEPKSPPRDTRDAPAPNPNGDPVGTPRHAHDQIRRRAYEIWESEGRPEGAELRHWQQACEELGGEDERVMSQDLQDTENRDDAALLQGAGESGDFDPGSGKS